MLWVPKEKMNVLMRSCGDERFDRQPVNTARMKAPSFSKGNMRADRVVRVFFKSSTTESLTCHTDVLTYWSPRLRSILHREESEQMAKQLRAYASLAPELREIYSGKPPLIINIKLLDVHHKTFAMFLDWAVCDKLPDIKMLLDVPARADIRDGQSWKSFYYRQPEAPFLEAYIFGRRYKIREFRNDMFDCFWEIVTMRTKGKEDDDSGSLMPSLFVLHRAVTKLGKKDPARVFLTNLFQQYVPNKITTEQELLCAIELHEEHGFLDMYDTDRKGPVRKGPEEMDTLQEVLYCCNHHEHLGDEAAECWAMPDETREYWKRKLSDSSIMTKGDDSGDDSEAEMTENSTDVETDDDLTDDGLPDLISGAFNAWTSVEPDSDSEDEAFNDDDGYGGEDEDEENGKIDADMDDFDEENDEIDVNMGDVDEDDIEYSEENNIDEDYEMDCEEERCQVELEADEREFEEGENEPRECMAFCEHIAVDREHFCVALEGGARTDILTDDLANDRMAGIVRPAEKTMMRQDKTCKEVLGQDLWDFPTELDAETMDKLASPNEPPSGFQGKVAERYRAPW